jgi:D-3-phosphoglycerate dehydrogenase
MYRIKTLNEICVSGLKHFDGYRLTTDGLAEGIILRSYKMTDGHLNDELLAIARAGAGVNNIPVDLCTEKGIVVFNTPGANANAVKELVAAGLLLSTRKIIDGINWINSLEVNDDMEEEIEKGKSRFTGPELCGKKVCVVGLGAIGVKVANICYDFKMEVYGYDPFITVEAAWGLSRKVKRIETLDAILPECDFVTLHMPVTNETKGMVNKDLFKMMKKGVRLLNFARAELVDAADLNDELNSGMVAEYVTDFPTKEVMKMPNVIAIPHLGASTPESEDNCAQMAAAQLKNYLESGTIENSVNFPSFRLPRCNNKRFFVLHRNVPNMIGQITAVISKHNLNIDSMRNKNKGAYACTVIDVDEMKHSAEIEADILGIKDILRVRII